MGDRIWLNMQDLDEVNAGVIAAIDEFTNAEQNTEDMQSAIDHPAVWTNSRDGELRGKVGDFESDWNDNREQLNENLSKVQEHLQAIIDGFREFDTEAAASLDEAAQEQLSHPGPDNTPI